tara:strand:+ start:1084 stop:1248 length:165 start_codon:yes stop_codon:yes gene_type:complete
MMKKLFVFAVLLGFTIVSCTDLDPIENENIQSNGEILACPAPDTNCNGIPDHEE